MSSILGLDIGGANTKGCYLESDGERILKVKGRSIYHEVWRDPDGLCDVLSGFRLFGGQRTGKSPDGIALSMTAELCDCFESKAEGVLLILSTVERAFPEVPIRIWTTGQVFVGPSAIRSDPLQAAAANWLASATALVRSPHLRDSAIFADMGSTTTDILPIIPGKVLARGRTDTERLLWGELLYTGLLRTSVHSLIDEVYIDGSRCRVAHEYFAITADVYRLLGLIPEAAYNVATPDGKSRDTEACAKRLARVVGAEPEELGSKNIYWLARMVMEKQTEQIMYNILQIVSAKDVPPPKQLILTGSGSFILREAARRLGLMAIPWRKMIPGAKAYPAMTCYAVAWLLSQQEQRRM
ncbi:hydantoinase/oxoprolinase family protein [Desulfoscipio sp. XC116]|uniref:hydantoinase/oxoprolinase family protein n=1 Tax=Desulfoscipio sp. XC116 TaxID=3144975 RepID=UPI00325A9175